MCNGYFFCYAAHNPIVDVKTIDHSIINVNYQIMGSIFIKINVQKSR